MILYQVQVSIDKTIRNEWLNWMITKHIPDVLNTGLFLKANLFEQLVESDKEIFMAQYYIKSIDDLNEYRDKYSPTLQKEHSEKFGEKFTANRYVLQLVKSFME